PVVLATSPTRGHRTLPLPPVALRFFFQAEDGIRDRNVTGVQTCALPICAACSLFFAAVLAVFAVCSAALAVLPAVWPARLAAARSEERRVGKECGDRGAPARWTPRGRHGWGQAGRGCVMTTYMRGWFDMV